MAGNDPTPDASEAAVLRSVVSMCEPHRDGVGRSAVLAELAIFAASQIESPTVWGDEVPPFAQLMKGLRETLAELEAVSGSDGTKDELIEDLSDPV